MSPAEVLTTDDDTRWRELLPARESVFGSVEFASIQRRHSGAEPRLFTIGRPDGRIALPLLLRSTDALPFPDRVDRPLYDARTPDYTGPLAPGPLGAAARATFADALEGWCVANGVVTEFGHLHPWKGRSELLDPSGLELDREIVYVDLTQDGERMWRESFNPACRKNIKRARREGVVVRPARGETD